MLVLKKNYPILYLASLFLFTFISIAIYCTYNYSTILIVWSSFVLLAAYLFLVLYKKSYKNHYIQEQNAINQYFKINNFSASSKKDWGGLILLSVWAIIFFAINTLLYNGYRHNDTIGYLISTNIEPQIWANRFFPFAHQEFNVIPHNLYLIRSLVSLQLVICMYYLLKIVPLLHYWQRSLAVILITLSPYFFYSYIQIITNDRDAIFWVILSLYNIIKFYQKPKTINLIAALFFANIAIYYKEPVFSFFAIFALTSLTLKLFKKEFTISYLFKHPIRFLIGYPLEIGFLIASSMFVINYLIYLTILSGGHHYGSSDLSLDFLLIDWTSLVPVLIVVIYILNIKYKFIKKHLHIPILCGGVAYLVVVLTNIKIITFTLYYKCIFDLTAMIFLFSLIAQMKKLRKLKILLVLLLVVVSANSIKVNLNYYRYITIYEQKSTAIINYFKSEAKKGYFLTTPKTIFAYIIAPNPKYNAIIRMYYIAKAVPINKFKYYSPDGCPHRPIYSSNCHIGVLKGHYDYLIIYLKNNSARLPKSQFNYFKKHYHIQRITNFPKWLKASNQDIYVIKNYNESDAKLYTK